MKKFIIFSLLAIVVFSSFMGNIGGLKVKTAKPKEGERMGTTTIILKWSKIPEWWQRKTKNLFRRGKEEPQKPKK